MKISIAICTHNRAAVLQQTLASLESVDHLEQTDVELLVVDNRSTDATKAVVDRHLAASRIACRYLFEPALGISNARNRAIAEAAGDLIAFADDDVFFDTLWLAEIVKAFEEFPDAMCVSGAILPHYEAGRPEWLDPDPPWLNMEGMFSITSFGSEARYLAPHETPVGANFAFRREPLRRLGGFSGALGRHGNVLLSKEESELFFRINRAGYKAVCAPKAIVHHRIPQQRTTKQWMARRFYWQGISQAVFEQLTTPRSRSALLGKVAADLGHLKSFLLGSSWSPLQIYWHVRGYRFYHRVFAAYLFALIRKRLSIALFGQQLPDQRYGQP